MLNYFEALIKNGKGQILLRRGIQAFFLLFYMWVGLNFFFYVQWAMGISDKYLAKMPSVAAFLPIGALVGAKRLLLTGQYETVHPASLSIFLLAIILALALRKSFCAYLCPVGTVANILEKIGSKLQIQRRPPKWLSFIVGIPKYIFLAFFAYLILTMDISAIEGFVQTTYWRVADSKMLFFFLNAPVFVFVCIGVIVLGNMLISGFWCQGFCPYGAFLGLFSFFSPLAVTRNEENCVSCQHCSKACSARIEVHKKRRINSPDCVGCAECLAACPKKDCLSMSFGYGKNAWKIPPSLVAWGSIFFLVLVWVWALNTGHWYAPVNKDQIRADHAQIFNISHP